MANKLSLVFLVLAISQAAIAVEWTHLRAHYALNAFDGFFQMPRTLTDPESASWTPINAEAECISSGDNNTFAGFRFENPEDDGVVLIFDVNGIIAGIQARMPHEDMLPASPVNPFRFEQVPMFQNITENGKTYFVLTAYFVNPEIICTTGRSEADLELEGTGTGVWFQNGPTPQDLIEIPKMRTEAINQGWTNNACFPGMGLHNFYKVEEYDSHNCTASQPTFALFNSSEEELLGFGFTVTGNTPGSKYFEHPPNAAISIILGEPVPECVIPTNDLMGTTTLHVYFTSQPWLLQC